MKSYILLIVFLVFSCATNKKPFIGEDYESGMIDFEEGDDMFYWLFRSRSRPSSDPLVIWLSGGPGCAGEIAIFYQNGPWSLQPDLTLEYNKYSWNEKANVLYIDQPFGTGFSSTDSFWRLARNYRMYSDAFYTFILRFMEKYPEYKGRELFITGVSYAGHFIPPMASLILEKHNADLNLKAVAIGNGWVNPIIHYHSYPTFSAEHGIITPLHAGFLKIGYMM